jgi:hypothetical protein
MFFSPPIYVAVGLFMAQHGHSFIDAIYFAGFTII